MELEDIQRLNDIEEQQSKQRDATSGRLLVQVNLVMNGLAEIKRSGVELRDIELARAVQKVENVASDLKKIIHNKFLV